MGVLSEPTDNYRDKPTHPFLPGEKPDEQGEASLGGTGAWKPRRAYSGEETIWISPASPRPAEPSRVRSPRPCFSPGTS